MYVLLNKEEQEYFLDIFDSSNYPYIKLDFEADEVRRRIWEKKLYFELFKGHVINLELYCDTTNLIRFYSHLDNLTNFKKLNHVNLLFFCGFKYNLVKTKILNIKLNIKTLRKINLYTFFEDRQIPKELRL